MHQINNVASKLKLMHNGDMRTTISLDDEIHEFAAYYARSRGLSLSTAINELIRKAETAPTPPLPKLEYSEIGLPMLPRTGRTITCEMVKKLEEEEYDPAKFA
jgi:hypothetical protein